MPVDLLRYRKDNGRIASDVINYEKLNGPLDEKDTDAQEIIGRFLADKDPEKMEILSSSIAHIGQSEPAIITADGFLINGNRRKMVLDALRKQTRGRTEFDAMKVVVLPGANDPGGPPTLIEIERLENRYQLQSEGKSEYYGFDRALSMKRNMELGFSLEEQLRDDPRYANASEKEIDQAIREAERDFLRPLECVDRYLKTFGRERLNFHRELLTLCCRAKCMILLSGYDTPLYRKMLRAKDGWRRVSIKTRTRDTDGNDYVRNEMLWQNKHFVKARKNGRVPIRLTKAERRDDKVNPSRS